MNILRKLIVLCFLFCLSMLDGQAQIVGNRFFHGLNITSPLINCTTANVTVATATNLLQGMCASWGTPTNGTPDFYYGCDNIPAFPANTDYGVPINIHFDGPLEDPFYPSTTSSRQEQAYVGIEMRETTSSTYREYITQELDEALQPGVYTISIMVRASNQTGNYLIKQLECLFTTFRPTPGHTSNLSDGAINPAIGNYITLTHPTGFPSDQWYTTTAQVIITGATKTHLTIGNFQANIADADWVAQHPEDDPVATDQGYAYYFIDNVFMCEPCAVDVEVTKVNSEDATKCCYTISVNSEARSCSVFSGIRIRTAASEILYSENTAYGWASEDFSVCLDRFESQAVVIELLGPTGQVLCSKSRELICDCRCDDMVNPQGVTVRLRRLATNSCCWNVELVNNGNCTLVTKGIVITAPTTANISLHPGYKLSTVGSVTYLEKSAPGDDDYGAGTTTAIATICLERGTFSYPLSFDIVKGFGPDNEPIYCGRNYRDTIACTDACCDYVLSAIQRSVSSGNLPQCCFSIDVQLYYKFYYCIRTVTVQRYNGTTWVDESTRDLLSPVTTANFSISQCIPAGTTKQIRLVFKNASGAAVCIKPFTLSCDCCAAINNVQAIRITQNPCCFRINGYAFSSPDCPITNYLIEQYQPMTGMWNPVMGGAPAPNGYFESNMCIYNTTSATIRIHFRNSTNGIICTRQLTLNCSSGGGGPIGKMGANNTTDNLQSQVYAVPNPAIDETTIHYTLRETSDVRFSLYNMLGEMMIEIQSSQVPAGDQMTTIPTNELVSGMYFMQVQAGNGVVTIPITIVK